MPTRPDRRHVTRRKTLLTVGAGAAVSLGGCLGLLGSDSAEAPDPVDLSGGKLDYQGGMEIGRHGGPNGQIFYADNEPESTHATGDHPDARADLAWFHTLVHGLFPYQFERGWDTDAIYVTDYSTVTYEQNISERGGSRRMPAPTNPDKFADATGLTYVGESDLKGGMGPALFPFSDAGDADSFVAEYGGQTYAFDDISPALINQLQSGMDMDMDM
jgi:nitrous oxide reductase accessory protein NosL